MSVRLVANTLDYVHGIPHGAKLVLICMADHANDADLAWPSFDKLAKRCDMSRRHVIRVMADLEKWGLIVRFEEVPYKPTKYRLMIPTSDTHVTTKEEEVVTPTSLVTPEPLVTSMSLGSDAHVTTTSDAHVTPIINKPSENHQGAQTTRSRKAKKGLIPEDFAMTEATEAWCQKRGYSRQLVEQQLQAFVLSAEANGREYANWQKAFQTWLMNCETRGWGHVKESQQRPLNVA